MQTISFTAYGVAQPAGSKKAFVHRDTGKVVVTDDAKQSRPWKNEVAMIALAAMNGNGNLLDGPLAVQFTFFVPRPRGHFGRRGLRPSAPGHPTKRPDVLKLARAVEDALTAIVWRDDAQIVHEEIRKLYGEPARCEIVVTPL